MVKNYVIPIYGAKVTVCISENYDKDKAMFKNKFGNVSEDFSDLDCFCCWNENNFGVFIIKEKLDINILAHELFHLTIRILTYYELKFDVDNHESYAYLNGYLNELIVPDIIKKVKTFKKELITK